jgi:hypothetical protein
MDKLMKSFDTDPNLMAILHQAPSHSYALDATAGSTLRVCCKTADDTDLIFRSLLEYLPKDDE